MILHWKMVGKVAAYKQGLETSFPESAAGRIGQCIIRCNGAPAFNLSLTQLALRIVYSIPMGPPMIKWFFDDVQNNTCGHAVYLACEDPAKTPRDRIVLPLNSRNRTARNLACTRSPYTQRGKIRN
jgi:hypothetical protein